MITENYLLTKYKWDNGIYKIEDVMRAVEEKKITKQDFLQITRYDYDGFKECRDKINET